MVFEELFAACGPFHMFQGLPLRMVDLGDGGGGWQGERKQKNSHSGHSFLQVSIWVQAINIAKSHFLRQIFYFLNRVIHVILAYSQVKGMSVLAE